MFVLKETNIVLSKVSNFIKQHQLLDKSDEIALAISGGMDSTCAAYVLEALKIPFVAVHCNFQLRGDESTRDEDFVRALGSKLKMCKAVHCQRFKTEQFAKEMNLGIQEAARELRYAYFQELKTNNVFTKLITAHHAQDDIETFLINLSNGTGIKGLKSIPIQRDYIIRPFLDIEKSEIEAFCRENKIDYCIDSSNASDKYLRNKIRNDVVPFIEEHVPGISSGIKKTIHNLKAHSNLWESILQKLESELIDYQVETSIFRIAKSGLDSYPHRGLLLYYMLDKYGFNPVQCEDVAKSIGQTGKVFESNKYRLLIDREYLLLDEKQEPEKAIISIKSEGTYGIENFNFSIYKTTIDTPSKEARLQIVSIPIDKFPLQLRFWQEGDWISPLGMTGSKLLSDFFIDSKIDTFSKQKLPLICSGNEVLWIPGFIISESIKLPGNQEYYKLELSKMPLKS